MDFKIRIPYDQLPSGCLFTMKLDQADVDVVKFGWDNDRLVTNSTAAYDYLAFEMTYHVPTLIRLPDEMDYTNDMTMGANVYKAILAVFHKAVVEQAPTDEFMGQFEGAIY
ncbi:hypothetical protein ACFP3T_06735 [Lactiplantibacillus dongliensis]|uniref:Prophage protein n=1 Tax=Lactiplantibacillus dongliensis TaxID=2559919 RepID=A0ABW1R3G0_9LACO|nr:hypothetical protein [Lactiplantibacillus dongliensis]